MQKIKNKNFEDKAFNFLSILIKPLEEIYKGVISGELPLLKILSALSFLNVLLIFKADVYLAKYLKFEIFLQNFKENYHSFYVIFISLLPLFLWSIYKAALWIKVKDKLETAFIESGIKSPSGRLPGFIDDIPIDEETRKLRLYKNKIPYKVFKDNESSFAQSLGFFIDEIKENREREEIKITYSLTSIPKFIQFKRLEVTAKNKIQIGQARGNKKFFDFTKDPHLLVAGQSGNGKSTFLRQAITSLYLNNKDMEFLLIDLKKGLEFQTFENLKRVLVIEDHIKALSEIKTLFDKELDYRMKLLKSNGVKDIDDFNKLAEKINPDGTEYVGKKLCRKMLVIDEAAQLYFVSRGGSSKDANEARDYTNRLVATGRAAGIHIIICTQRPDRFSVDPITKANLTAKLCFRLPNQASSRVVLDSGRACELPEIKGRAVFQMGSEEFEVQVPYISVEETEELLIEHKSVKKTKLEHKNEIKDLDKKEGHF